jgi:hypothetical protein
MTCERPGSVLCINSCGVFPAGRHIGGPGIHVTHLYNSKKHHFLYYYSINRIKYTTKNILFDYKIKNLSLKGSKYFKAPTLYVPRGKLLHRYFQLFHSHRYVPPTFSLVHFLPVWCRLSRSNSNSNSIM